MDPNIVPDPLPFEAIKQETLDSLALDVLLAPQSHGHETNRPPAFTGLAFHNPFEMNLYPITNPPILDLTVLPYGEPGVRRRRISISNGQIGQIVNHEAFFMDEDLWDDLTDLSPYAPPPERVTFEDHFGPLGATSNQVNTNANANANFNSNVNANISANVNVSPNMNPGVDVQNPALSLNIHLQNVHDLLRPPSQPQSLVQTQPAPVQTLPPSDPPSGPTPGEVPPPQSGAIHGQTQFPVMAGVPPPNHQLIYNNEVIFNPNNGPIPGTAAWKKERLLERNRIAASKCRQRKKHAQQQLQDNMNKTQRQLKVQSERLVRYEKLVSKYNEFLLRHLQDSSDPVLEPLRPFLAKLIDDIAVADLDAL